MIYRVLNPETDNLEKTYLTSAISTGATSLAVVNNEGFANNQRLLIGELGGEKTEIVTCSGTSGDTSLTIGATNFSHDANTPIYILRFDQAKIYRSTNGGSTYSLLATVDLDVDNANLATDYDDTTGLTSYYYKNTLYHSISTVESDYSDPIKGEGYLRNQTGYIIDEVLQEVGDQAEQFVSRSELLGYFNDVNDDLQTYAAKPFDFLHTRTTLTRTASTNYVDFPTDSNGNPTMWKFDRMDHNYVDTSTDPDTDKTYTLKIVDAEYFRNRYQDNTIDSTTEDDETSVMALDTSVNRFRFYPPASTTQAGAFYLHYWKFFNRIDSEGDEIETPTPRIYKLYLKAMYYRKRSASEPQYNQMADRLFADYGLERSRMTSHNRKDVGTPRGFRPTDSTFRRYRVRT